MSPEEEAQLRAQMAKIREEADITASPTTIDLDEPEPERPWNFGTPEEPVVPSSNIQGYTDWKNRFAAEHGFSPEKKAYLDKKLTPMTAEEQAAFDKKARAALNYMGLAPTQSAIGTGAWAANSVAQHAPWLLPAPLGGVGLSAAKGAMEREESKQTARELTDATRQAEERNRKALAVAKAIAAQKKAEDDVEETYQKTGGGYRVQRALYPSDLHRK